MTKDPFVSLLKAVFALAALALLYVAAAPTQAAVPLVMTWQERDTAPIPNVKMNINGVPTTIQVDEGSNYQIKMDAGRFKTQTESDILIIEEDGSRRFLSNCDTTAEICATQSADPHYTAKWVVYQKSIGRSTFKPNISFTNGHINDDAFNAYTNELWLYNTETKQSKRLTSGHHDITPAFCGDKLLWSSDRAGIYPPYHYDAGNIYPHKAFQIHSAPFDPATGTLGEITNISPHEMLAMSPSCLSTGEMIWSSYQGYSERGRYKFNTTPQNVWWVTIVDGNGANALTVASMGAHNSPYIPTAVKIQDELSDWGGAKVSTHLILRPCRQIGLKNGKPYIVCGNYYRTNHVGGGGELLGYTKSDVEGVSVMNNWTEKHPEYSNTRPGSGQFVPKDMESLTPWGNGFDNPQRFDKQGRIMGKASYAAPYPGGDIMFTWSRGVCYEAALANGIDWLTKERLGGEPLCQAVICKTPRAMSANPHKECEILAGGPNENVWDAKALVPTAAPAVQAPIAQGGKTELRVVDAFSHEVLPILGGGAPMEYKRRKTIQGHANLDFDGRYDQFCVDIVEPWDTLPQRIGYKNQTLHKCVVPALDGSLVMDVPPDTLLVMYGIDSKFDFTANPNPTEEQCLLVRHGLCIVVEDQMFHSLRPGEKRTCHGCHDVHSEERWQEVGRVPAEQRFKQTESFTPAGC